MDIQLFVINPIVGTIIGYFTNWLAIKMLFRPYDKKVFLGVTLPFTPGLIPKERQRLAAKVGEAVGRHLLTDKVLTEAFANSDIEAYIDPFADEAIRKLQESTLKLGDIIAPLEKLAADVLPVQTDSLREYIVEQAKNLVMGEGLLSKLPLAAEFMEKLPLEHPDLEEGLKQFTAKVIEEGVGHWASIFVNEEKIYRNLKKGLIDYLRKEETKEFLRKEMLNNLPQWAALGEEWLLNIKLSELVAGLDGEAVERLKIFLKKCIRYLAEKGAVYVVKGMDIRKLVEDRINEFETPEAEEIILSVVKKELNAITLLGGLLGFVIGMVPAILKLAGI